MAEIKEIPQKTFGEKVKEKANAAKTKIKTAAKWCWDNKEGIALVAPVVIAGAAELRKGMAETRRWINRKSWEKSHIVDRGREYTIYRY